MYIKGSLNHLFATRPPTPAPLGSVYIGSVIYQLLIGKSTDQVFGPNSFCNMEPALKVINCCIYPLR